MLVSRRAPKLPPQRASERLISLGENASGTVETSILGRNILIAGDPRSGKSWIAGLFVEHLLLQGYCLCVIDPEGDYSGLAALPDVLVYNDAKPPRLSNVERALKHPNTSIVIDLSSESHEEKLEYVRELLPMLARLRRKSGRPHWILVDEAHYFLDRSDAEFSMNVVFAAYVLVTYRPSHIHSVLLNATGTIIVTSLTDPEEVMTLTELNGTKGAEHEWAEVLGGLKINEAAMVPRHSSEGCLPQRFTVGSRLAAHVRHRSKYTDVPMPIDRSFYFTCHGRNFGPPARTLKEFVSLQARLPVSAMEEHARRGDFSNWIAKVFSDHPLAAEISAVEERFRRGREPGLRGALIGPITERYELSGK